jgi:hypothetical protein
MEKYTDKLKRECKEIEEKYPEIKKIIDGILNINRISSMEFDYEIERTHLMYNEIKNILKYS